MPLYEFSCRDCGHPFEERRSMTGAGAPAVCPRCGGDNTRRRLSHVSFVSRDTRASIPVSLGNGGGCACGGSCACGH